MYEHICPSINVLSLLLCPLAVLTLYLTRDVDGERHTTSLMLVDLAGSGRRPRDGAVITKSLASLANVSYWPLAPPIPQLYSYLPCMNACGLAEIQTKRAFYKYRFLTRTPQCMHFFSFLNRCLWHTLSVLETMLVNFSTCLSRNVACVSSSLCYKKFFFFFILIFSTLNNFQKCIFKTTLCFFYLF
jgi:hypothetical protein